MAARLRLNDTQIFVLMKLVKEFYQSCELSKKTKEGVVVVSSSKESKQPQQQEQQEQDEGNENRIENELVNQQQQQQQPPQLDLLSTSLPRIVQNGKLSAEWLSRFMVHLRVTWKAQVRASIGNTSATVGVIVDGALKPSQSYQPEAQQVPPQQQQPSQQQSSALILTTGTPKLAGVGWDDWVTQKKSDGKLKLSSRAREFRKALAGQAHTLSKETLDKLLDELDIIPEEILSTIIDIKIKFWSFDVDGRGDFQHKLNVELEKFQRSAEGTNWKSLSEKKKKEIMCQLNRSLCDIKKKEYLSMEATSGSLTKELYWKYDRICRDNSYSSSIGPWGTWLENYQRKETTHLKQIQQKSIEHRRARAHHLSHGKSMAALNELEQKLTAAAKSMSTVHGIELRKGLISLRRAAQDRGQGKGAVVLKADYDRILQNMIQPRAKELPGSLKILAAAEHTSSVGGRGGECSNTGANYNNNHNNQDCIFLANEEAVVERVIKTDNERTERDMEEFELWKKKKLAEKQKSIADEVQYALAFFFALE